MADSRQCSRPLFSRRLIARRAPALLASLLLAGCAERYEIGELGAAPGPQQLPPSGDSHFVDTLLAADFGDGDAVVDQELDVRAAVGDVDGDGYDDWVTQNNQLIYGGPRPRDALLRVPADVPQFAWQEDPDFGPTMNSVTGAGDVNGDGFADLLFSSSFDTSEIWASAQLERTLGRCSSRRAYLWYGRPERLSGIQDLPIAALGFDPPDDLTEQVRNELVALVPASEGYSLHCELELAPAGDLNGDGYADLSLSSRFDYQAGPNADPPQAISGDGGTTHLLYGHSGRAHSQAEELSSAPQLADVHAIVALGDVDGDGNDELLVTPTRARGGSRATRLLPGSTQRLQGEVPIAQRGIPLQGFGSDDWQGRCAGDLDGDGMRDFLIEAYEPNGVSAGTGDVWHFIFYGGPQRALSAVQASQADAIIRVPLGLGFVRAAGDWQGDGFNDLSLALTIHPGSEAQFRFRPDGDASPRDAELRQRAFDWQTNELRLLSGGSARMSGTYAPLVFRPELTPPLTAIPTVPERHLYPGGPIGDFDGDGRADLLFSVSAPGRPNEVMIKYGAPLPPSTPPLH